MARIVRIAAAQLGPIARAHSRAAVVERLLDAMTRAAREGADLVAFPELALTTFFPRWFFPDAATLDAFFETAMPDVDTQPLFDAGRRLGLAWSIGYAEKVDGAGRTRRYNTSIVVDRDGTIAVKYRKVHLPGHVEYDPDAPFQHLEKRYFEVGDLGYPVREVVVGVPARVGLMICNDRRWPEAYRLMGLQRVELILLGYNTPLHNPEAPAHDRLAAFHSRLVMQAGAYQNATWVVGVAKGGCEEDVPQLAETMIVAPSGEVVAQAATDGDELVIADCDLDLGISYRTTIFDLAAHRQPQCYGGLVD